MVEDLAIEAKEAAVREVAKLLTLPELLQSIASIKADYITRQQVSLVNFACSLVYVWNMFRYLRIRCEACKRKRCGRITVLSLSINRYYG